MSKLQLQNGDDHPEAAQRHLDDALVLNRATRPDGAAYLAGYVVECSLKTLILLETGVTTAHARLPWRKGRDGHDLKVLAGQASSAAALAGAKTARYVGSTLTGFSSAPIAGWDPELRYRAPSMTQNVASAWLADAQALYQQTVGQMLLDGVL